MHDSNDQYACIDNVNTWIKYPYMSKTPVRAPHSGPPTALAVAAPVMAANVKGSINLRVEAHTRQMIDEAAALLGKTRTEFMIDSARSRAIDTLLDQRLFVLEPDRYDAFMYALDNPPAPGPKLRALVRRTPTWAT